MNWTWPQIRAELEVSRTVMEQELGERMLTFAYPYAFPSADRSFVAAFTGLLKDTGYECNVTTRIGRVRNGDDPFTLKRLPANSADDAALFRAKLRGAYDWMNRPQDTLKKLKSAGSPTAAMRRNRARASTLIFRMTMTSRRYIIICPVRNEEAHLPGTIESVVAQTVRPARWIIVNDGSSDRTGEDRRKSRAQTYDWITRGAARRPRFSPQRRRGD